MAATNDDLLISISTDLTAVRRQLKQLTTDIGQATSGIAKQFDGMGKSIDQSMSPIQKRINDMVGIANSGGKPFKEWKGALADVSTGLGATAQGFKLSRAGMMEFQAAGVNAFQALASGMSVARVAQMEGAQVLGAAIQGTEGGLKGLGAQAVSLATKFPLATAAIAAAGIAVAAYLALGGSSIRSLDEILKSHEENIKRLGDAYDQVVGKQQKYAQVSAATANLVNDKDLSDAKKKLQAAIGDIFSSATTQSGVGKGGGTREFVKAQFQPFEDELDKLKASAKDTSALRAFLDAVTAIGQANPDLKGPAQDLISFAKGALDASSAVETMSGAIPGAIDNVTAFNRALAAVDSKPIQAELQALFDKAREGKAPIDAILESLAALEQANPNFSGILAGFAGILKAAADTAAALDALGSKFFANQGTPTNGRQKLPVGLLPDSVDVVPSFPNKEDLGAAYDKAQKKGSASKAPKKTAADQFANDIQAIKDRTAALNEEFNALGLSYKEQQQRQIALQLEQTALKQVREEARKKGDVDWKNAQLSPAQIKAIDDVSSAYARQADQLKKAQEAQQLQRDILQGVFDDLRGALEDGKLTWQDFGNIAMGVLDKIISKIETDLIDSIMQANNAAGGGGGILGSILGLFTGGGGSADAGIIASLGLRANGGPVSAGQPYIVGERRPELFVPNQSGFIVPQVPAINGSGGGGASYQDNRTISIDARGAQQGVGEEIKRALTEYDRHSVPRTLAAIREAKKRGMA